MVDGERTRSTATALTGRRAIDAGLVLRALVAQVGRSAGVWQR